MSLLLLFTGTGSGGGGGVGSLLLSPPVRRYASGSYGTLVQLHGQIRNVLDVGSVRGAYTFSNSYSTGGESLVVTVGQRVIVDVLVSRLANGVGVTYDGSKLKAWNLDGSGNLTTEKAAGTDLSAVVVPIIVLVVNH